MKLIRVQSSNVNCCGNIGANIGVQNLSTDCERVISANNRLKSTFRVNLGRETIVGYLYINVNMPKLGHFDPWPAVLKWLTDKNRHRDIPKVAKQQLVV